MPACKHKHLLTTQGGINILNCAAFKVNMEEIMNKLRRKQLDEVIDKINNIKDELETIMNDEEEYKDNMPENLQGSERYEIAEAACDSMQEALDLLEDAISSIEEAKEN